MNKDLAKPEGLDEKGAAAYDAIVSYLRAKKLTYTGGCKAFYSPSEWAERGEEYGQKSKLVVVYDGGDLTHCFNMGYAMESKYLFYEGMRVALEEVGCYFEECTGWYAAIYER